MKGLLKIIFLIFGVTLLALMIYNVGVINLLHIMKQISYPMWIIILIIPLGWRILHALSFFILNNIPHSSLWSFIKAHIASIAVGDIYPAGQAGGEIYRVYYLGRLYPSYKEQLLAYIILYNTFYGIAVVCFFLFSILYLFLQLEALRMLLTVLMGFVFLLAIIIVIFMMLQQKNLFEKIVLFLGRLPFLKFLISKLLLQAQKIDQNLKGYIRNNTRRFLIFIFLMFISRFFSVLEVLAIGIAIHHPFSFTQALLFEMTNGIVQIVLFFVPGGQIGFLEAAINMIGRIISQPVSITLTLSLLKRVRSLFWNVIGLIFVFLHNFKKEDK